MLEGGDCGVEANLKNFIRHADPYHPLVNQQVAGKHQSLCLVSYNLLTYYYLDALAKRDARQRARIAASRTTDAGLSLKRLFDEASDGHFGIALADGDGAEVSGTGDTEMEDV